MTVESEIQAQIDPRARTSIIRAGTIHPLKHASTKLAEFREGRSSFKARDLVGLLLSHGARAWRASQPQTVTRLRVRSPNGVPAVRLRMS
ncbi:hypothetical protein [Aureimonas endophytica]|nr:hypothetical protein [Aureimonas endophytica]